MKALVVEDEDDLAASLARILLRIGVPADVARTRAAAEACAREADYDLVILDRRLPDGDGLDLIAILRASRPDLPILVLTALDEVADRIVGLDAGSDDYLAKPFDQGELEARVRALMRRPGLVIDVPIEVGHVSFDVRARALRVRGQPLALAARELNLIEALLQRAGRVVTREALHAAVYELDRDVMPNALDANVSRLRSRLRDLDAAVEITAVRGVGYMLTPVP